MEMRPYQSKAVDQVRNSILAGRRKPILVMPTGAGKTRTATEIVKRAVDKSKWVLFLAPRRELIYQTVETFERSGIDAGMIMAGEPRNQFARVQVATKDTLHARAIQSKRLLMPKADIVIVDEAHLSVTKSWIDILNEYPDAVVIGLTATPARGDGKGLGQIYDDLVQVTDIAGLTRDGYLVPVKYYAPSELDLTGIKQTKSDYNEKALGEFMDKPELIGDIWHNWKRIARDKKTVIFCTTRAHSRHVCAEFNRHGVKAEHLDGETPKDERKAILERVDSGKTQVLCNVFVATYGLDIPSLECAVLARPTKNISLYLQTVGRILRTSPGKSEAIVIDHSGAVRQHGFVDEFIPWTLHERDVRVLKDKANKKKKEPKDIRCGDCGTVFKSSRVCPSCGKELVPASEPIPVHQADLQEIQIKAKKANQTYSAEQKREFIGGLKAIASQKGYSDGWVSNQYRSKFGVWPNAYKDSPIIRPTVEVQQFVKSQQIAYAKSRQKRNAA